MNSAVMVRRLIAIAIGSLAFGMGFAPSYAVAQTRPELSSARDTALGIATLRLWEGRAPQAASDDPEEVPTLTLFRPQPGSENGTAVIVAPGGAYRELATILEGREVADWFTSRGVTAFVLNYRVGPKARLPIPLLDGVRAVRFVRANAAQFKIRPDRIGMIGFSAGGHLVATVAGTADAGITDSSDTVERTSGSVNFAILGYPWVEGMAVGSDGKSQYCTFAGGDCNPKAFARYRPVKDVTSNFPPTFIYHTTTDAIVDVSGVLAFYQALVAHNVPTEMHVFANGRHGTGMGGADPALARWPELLELWLRGQGFLGRP